MQRLEAAFHRYLPAAPPRLAPVRDALEVLGVRDRCSSNRLPIKPARAVGDDDHVRLGNALQARREVRRIADDAALLRFARSGQVADDDHPGRNPDCARCNGPTPALASFGTASIMRQPGLHGALGIVLMGLGIAEINQHAVAHVFGDEPAMALDQLPRSSGDRRR